MADVSRTVEIVFKGNNQLSGAVKGVESSLGGVSQEASEAESALGGMDQQTAALGSRGTANIRLLGLALQALAASVVVKEFIDANAALERFEKSLTFATGSSIAAAEELLFVTDASGRLGLNLLSTADAYSKFFAAASTT